MSFIDMSPTLRWIMIAVLLACAVGYMACMFLCRSRSRKFLPCLKYLALFAILLFLDSFLLEAQRILYLGDLTLFNNEVYVFSLGSIAAPLYVFIIVIAVGVMFISFYYELHKENNVMGEGSARHAINNMSMGIAFASEKGRLYLANHAMYAAVKESGFKRLGNANKFWENIAGCDDSPSVLIKGENKSWRFERETILVNNEKVYQIKAVDVTGLSNISNELNSSRVELEGHKKQLKNMMETMVETQKQEEILSSKVKIHDSLGRAVIMTRWRAWDEKKDIDEDALIKTWLEIIRKMKTGFEDENTQIGLMDELQEAASMLDCKLKVIGELPKNEDIAYLIVSAAREALTNAIKHANADTIYVMIERKTLSYNVIIYDNGETSADSVQEGGGLTGLRRRVEKEGGKMEVSVENGKVQIKLELLRRE